MKESDDDKESPTQPHARGPRRPFSHPIILVDAYGKGVWEQEKSKTLVVERANFDDDYGVIREALRLDVERVTAG